MSDERIQNIIAILDDYGIADDRLDGQEIAAWLRELKAAREEIARWEALPPRITEAVIRPVFPIQESDYPIDERGEN